MAIRYIVPSRGRPENVRRLWQAWRDTGAIAELYVIVDNDDPKLQEYEDDHVRYGAEYMLVVCMPLGNIGLILNEFSTRLAQHGFTDDTPAEAIGFMGDDHLPRTQGWDVRLLEALRERNVRPGIAYGRDGGVGDTLNLPTAVLIDAEIIRKLGWMVPPGLQHMYLDNFWRDLGLALGTLTQVTDVLIEHMHPTAGKSEMDEGYRRVNADEVYAHDAASYREFIDDRGLQRCVRVIDGRA